MASPALAGRLGDGVTRACGNGKAGGPLARNGTRKEKSSMFGWFRRQAQTPAIEALHEATVAAARRPALFGTLGIPDTPWGRIESVMLHALLIVRRLADPAAQGTAHALVDRMFADFDRGLRQVGVGDLAVPKKMEGLGGDWLARIAAYGPALDASDDTALAAALARNVMGVHDSVPATAVALAQ
ncbi:MAG: ubiquinol-cytochrome C chaperone family protein, partial [Beijerinckiaceae bacterium]